MFFLSIKYCMNKCHWCSTANESFELLIFLFQILTNRYLESKQYFFLFHLVLLSPTHRMNKPCWHRSLFKNCINTNRTTLFSTFDSFSTLYQSPWVINKERKTPPSWLINVSRIQKLISLDKNHRSISFRDQSASS